eukprot:2893641-Pyramimonas_sp.AAC.1
MCVDEETNVGLKADDVDVEPVFPEDPNQSVNELAWKAAKFRPIFHPEGIHISEMRCFLGTLRKRLL